MFYLFGIHAEFLKTVAHEQIQQQSQLYISIQRNYIKEDHSTKFPDRPHITGIVMYCTHYV